MGVAATNGHGSSPAVGFAGLGRMGAPIAANLAAAGFPLCVWNRDGAKAEAFASRTGCAVAASPAQLAAASDILVTMVADGDALEAIVLDDPAVLVNLQDGLLLDMSTTGPDFAVALAARLAPAGVRFAGAPVSGSTAAATAGTLALLVGASDEDFAEIEPLLAVMGGEIRHLGAPGTASLAKLAINNLIYGINQAAAEALVLAERGGLDRELIYDAFLGSAAAAPMLGYRREAFLHPREGEVAFTLALAEKDLRLTLELAERLGVPMPQAALNRDVARAAMAAGFGEDEMSIVAEHLRHAENEGPTKPFTSAGEERRT